MPVPARSLSALLTVVLFATAVSAQQKTVRPPAAPGPLDNPFKGWCPYTDAGTISQPYSMVFLYIPWNELEPNPGDYRFEEWEKSWDVETAVGKHIIFRVFVDYPSRPAGLPNWLRAAGVHESKYQDHGGGLSPDYNDPKMIAAMERLIAALGRRYNNHPRIAFIQLGMLGFWGEWHTWPRGQMYATAETERRVINAYHKAFPNKSLMVRYARDFAGRQPWIGFHDDMFPEDTDNGEDWSFLAGIRKSERTENWKVAVVGGEMVPHQAKKWVVDEFDQTMSMLERSHFTWIGPYGPALARSPTDEFAKQSEALVRKMGYQFRIEELKHPRIVQSGRPMSVHFSGQNMGVAPFYYPWQVQWTLLDTTGKPVDHQDVDWDIRRWLPGPFSDTAQLTFDVPTGRYRLAIGIIDPWTKRPAIDFANQVETLDGWTVLSEVDVK